MDFRHQEKYNVRKILASAIYVVKGVGVGMGGGGFGVGWGWGS